MYKYEYFNMDKSVEDKIIKVAWSIVSVSLAGGIVGMVLGVF